MSSDFSIKDYAAYGVTKTGLDFEELTILSRQLRDDELLLRVICNGVCGSDIHTCKNEWGKHGYDLVNNTKHTVPGHEAISLVVGMGKAVTGFKLFDRVGCGPARDSCLECVYCKAGTEHLCVKPEGLYSVDNTGGFGSYLTVPQLWCFHIPEDMPNEAAPLLCAGITTYSPLVRANLPKGSKVAVLGVGGLGLMGVQYSIALGYETYALTTSNDKRDMLMKLGCKDVVLYKTDQEQFNKYLDTFDFVLNTVGATIDTNAILMLVKKRGELCYCGLGDDAISINPMLLVMGEKRVTGSLTGSTSMMKDMLEFSTKNKIYPIVENVKVPFGQNNADQVTEWVKKVDAGKIRYRLVLDYDVDIDELKKQVLAAQSSQ